MFTGDLSGELIAFFILAAFTITGAVLMLTLTKVVHMVLSLAAVFIGLAGMYVVLEAEFVAFVQVLIYAGAVSILMVFGIMMTKHQEDQGRPAGRMPEVLGLLAAVSLLGILFYAIRSTAFPAAAQVEQAEDNTLEIGKLLFTQHVIPFELVSVLLTVAFIGAIMLARKETDE
ncbi:NADH-quinone oxidoreductase subunit J [Paenibacillus sambharensis]|uniref:NADH-quinone oxidoreductase subunit J n=1 Tax=Paenibacillus sambharensis TaxID=1803190 RepID=A0A2W1LGJ2_9BACL|nr:NADH-quinone oxidoreductase subunit J [Paenibacillus sambharensis]PZD97799.1 NADH-quinone oxidoreductase subunit J [Paenibacillus sambharensis]